jgi:hypothetical protein
MYRDKTRRKRGGGPGDDASRRASGLSENDVQRAAIGLL